MSASDPVTLSPAHPLTPTSAYRLEDADQMPRRVAVPVLRPSLSLCKFYPASDSPDEAAGGGVRRTRGGIGKRLTPVACASWA
ncbi:MAG: hypothetical protein H6661_03975 [Ardenticatenaceae bacterium]|nr:hypothetical protein [Ardenticatenaceae bacterium]